MRGPTTVDGPQSGRRGGARKHPGGGEGGEEEGEGSKKGASGKSRSKWILDNLSQKEMKRMGARLF